MNFIAVVSVLIALGSAFFFGWSKGYNASEHLRAEIGRRTGAG